MLFVSIVVSMEINRRHYFQSGLRIFFPQSFCFTESENCDWRTQI